ncbi:MAG TPA: helix-turn-helix domain-containing protein, partial [Planctomycetaceae bacterium]|nr:helix-turn-helix domain-containing protein [Planctomycetaceae bacterium]
MLNGPQAEPWLSHVEFRLLSLLAEGPRSFPEICKGFDEKVSRDRLRTAASRVELRKLVERIPFTERIERTRGRGGKVPQNVTAFALTVDGLNEAMKSLDYYRSAGERLATAKVLAPRDARVAVIVGREGARVLRAGEKVPRRAADEKERERLLKKASHEFRLCLRAVWECGLSRNEIETLDFADWVPGAKSVNLRDPSGSTRCVAVTSSMQECFDEAREMHLWGFVFGTVEGRRFTHPTWNREIKVARARTGIGADAQLFDSRGASRRPGAKLLNAMSPGFQRF